MEQYILLNELIRGLILDLQELNRIVTEWGVQIEEQNRVRRNRRDSGIYIVD